MKHFKTLIYILLMQAFSSCGAIRFAPSSKQTTEKNKRVCATTITDEEGNVMVRSGSHRNIRLGYYFDTKDGLCKQISYSTGPGCIPPPYNSIEECKSCKRKQSLTTGSTH